jgi:phosphatidylglycerophosphatase A
MIFQLSSEEGPTDKKNVRLALFVATFFYSGYSKVAPGTVASLLTMLLWAWPIYAGISIWVRFVAALALFVIGVWASERARSSFPDSEDPSAIVIDEVAGQTLALALCSAHFVPLLLAFALFRFFDVLKPGPIGWLDRNLKGGLGIMVDDMVAGAVSVVLVGLVQFAWLKLHN